MKVIRLRGKFPPELTVREVQVLQAVAWSDCALAEVARSLHISPRTMDAHLCNVRNKLTTQTTLGAVMRAIEKGYILPNHEHLWHGFRQCETCGVREAEDEAAVALTSAS